MRQIGCKDCDNGLNYRVRYSDMAPSHYLTVKSHKDALMGRINRDRKEFRKILEIMAIPCLKCEAGTYFGGGPSAFSNVKRLK